jgi:beta-galactosidase beta subunit
MTGPDSLVSRAKDLGFYKNKMTRDEIELELQKYWMFNEQQTHALGDMIYLCLYLAYNKREL